MVTIYGMNKEIGNISFYDPQRNEYSFDKRYSEATAEKIDQEVRKLIDEAYKRTLKLLEDKREELEVLAKALLEKEVIFQKDLEGLIGPRPYEKPTNYQLFTNGTQDDKKDKSIESKTDGAIENEEKEEKVEE